MIQGDLWENGKRRTIRVKVGEVGKIATREARAKAKVLLGSIADGVDPRPKPEEPAVGPGPNGPDPTLKQAWERYRDGHMTRKGRSGGTIENYRDHVERLMSDWLDFPLSKLGLQPELVRAGTKSSVKRTESISPMAACARYAPSTITPAKPRGAFLRTTPSQRLIGIGSVGATLRSGLPISGVGSMNWQRSKIRCGGSFIFFCCCRAIARTRSRRRAKSI